MPTVSLSAMDSPLMNVNSCNMRRPKFEKKTRRIIIIFEDLMKSSMKGLKFYHYSSSPNDCVCQYARALNRFEPLPISHVPIGPGGAPTATCDTGRRHRSGPDREPDVRQPHSI